MVMAMLYKRKKRSEKEETAMPTIVRRGRPARGFTLIEALVVLGIIGIFIIVSYPSVMHTMAVRNLDNATRQVQTFLQTAKNQAVNTKVVHRVRFWRPDGTFWAYDMERLEADGTWAKAQGNVPRKAISTDFNVTVALPAADGGSGYQVVFNPMGLFPEFTTAQNSITLQSPKLDRPDVMDERVLSIFLGGSIHFDRRKSS
jgi:prepilin-type N-terminal cleavage/methylation domain-containing protein